MKLRLAPRALAEAKRIKTWWRENRPAAPDLFEQELDAALERIGARPTSVGTLYEQGNLEAPVRRVLMPKTQNHVYFAVEGDEIVVVSVWGAPKRARAEAVGAPGRRSDAARDLPLDHDELTPGSGPLPRACSRETPAQWKTSAGAALGPRINPRAHTSDP